MPTYSQANGVVGRYYKTKTGMKELNLSSDEGENIVGWEQINLNERRLMRRKRISHSIVIWCLPTEKEYRPMNHRDDGALF